MSKSFGELLAAWQQLAEMTFQGMEGITTYLCDPSRLTRRTEYRREPTREWLTGALVVLQNAQHVQRHAGEGGGIGAEEIARMQSLAQEASGCVDLNLAWVREQLRRELETMTEQYHRAYWVEGIREGMPLEFRYIVYQRDKIEAHLRATELLHPALAPDPESVRRISLLASDERGSMLSRSICKMGE